jgi:phage gpG-like protein
VGQGAELDARQLTELLGRMRRRALALEPYMAVAAEVLVAGVQDEFDTEGRGQWPGLAASTLEQRRGTTAMILQDTGRFAGSIQASHGADWAEAATDVSYSVFHVKGTTRMPRRDPFDLPESVFDTALETIVRGMVAALEGA